MSRKTLVIAVILIAAVMIMIHSADENLDGERLSQLEEAIRRAAVSCYAIEGFYPSDTDYLVENYGLILDESKYTVFYDAFASNILPEITVLPNE